MTVTAISRKAGPFSGVGLTSFAFSFKCSDASELMITHTTSSGVETTLTKDAGYTVSLYADQDSVPGGTIALSTALLSGEKLTITSGIELTQPTTILNAGAFLPQVVEETFDRLEMQIQQQQVDIDRCVKVDVSGSVTADELRQALLDGSTANALSAAASATAAAASATAAASLLLPKTYKLINSSGTSAWRLFTPGGTEVDVSASATSGLQEMINLAYANGGNIEVIGAGTNHEQDFGLMYATTPVYLKPMRNMVFKVLGVHLLSTPSTLALPAIVFDSCMMVDFEWIGELVYMGTGSCVLINARNPPGSDPLISMVDSRIHISNLGCYSNSGSDSVVSMSLANSSITNCRFSFVELNGNEGSGSTGTTTYGLKVTGAASGNHFARNIITCPHSHGSQVPLALGDDNANAANVYSNVLDFVSETSKTSATGMSIMGCYNVIRGVSRATGSSSTHLSFSSSATGNDVTLAQASATVVDSNGHNSYTIAGVRHNAS